MFRFKPTSSILLSVLPPKKLSWLVIFFASGSPQAIGQRVTLGALRVTLSALRVTESDSIGQRGTALVGARCGIVRHRRCPQSPLAALNAFGLFRVEGLLPLSPNHRAKGGGRIGGAAARHHRLAENSPRHVGHGQLATARFLMAPITRAAWHRCLSILRAARPGVRVEHRVVRKRLRTFLWELDRREHERGAPLFVRREFERFVARAWFCALSLYRLRHRSVGCVLLQDRICQ